MPDTPARPVSAMPDAELQATAMASASPAEPALEAFKELHRRSSPAVFAIARSKAAAKSAPTALRAAAAVTLGQQASRENEAALLKALDPQVPALIKHVVHALGRIGDAATLRKLEAMPTPIAVSDARALGFAKSLISYRQRLNLHQLRPALPAKRITLDGAKADTLKVSSLRSATVDAVAADLQRAVPGIALTTKGALQFTCRNSHYMIILTRALDEAGDIATFGKRNGVLAVVLKQTVCSVGAYALYEYIFASAAEGDQIGLVGVRASGEVIHAGEINLADGGSFALAAEDSVHAIPLSLQGKLGKGAVKAAIATILVSPVRSAGQRQPQQAVPDRIIVNDPPRAIA